jgi:hypothetical protein
MPLWRLLLWNVLRLAQATKVRPAACRPLGSRRQRRLNEVTPIRSHPRTLSRSLGASSGWWRSGLTLVACVRHRSSFPLPRPSGSAGFPCLWWDQPESSAFVNCYVFSFITLDEILWRFTRGVMHIPLHKELPRHQVAWRSSLSSKSFSRPQSVSSVLVSNGLNHGWGQSTHEDDDD